MKTKRILNPKYKPSRSLFLHLACQGQISPPCFRQLCHSPKLCSDIPENLKYLAPYSFGVDVGSHHVHAPEVAMDLEWILRFSFGPRDRVKYLWKPAPLSREFSGLRNFWLHPMCATADHYPVCRLDIRQDSEFATRYGYPKTAFKQKPHTDPDIRKAFIDISKVQTFGKSCTMIYFVSWIFGSSFSDLESWWLQILSMLGLPYLMTHNPWQIYLSCTDQFFRPKHLSCFVFERRITRNNTEKTKIVAFHDTKCQFSANH